MAVRQLFIRPLVLLLIVIIAYGLAAPIATGLVAGGPAAIFWGCDFSRGDKRSCNHLLSSWVLVSAFAQTLALSLAEISSKYPTSAGACYYCFCLAPPNCRLLYSWINGWLTMVGVWTVSLSVTFVSISNPTMIRMCEWRSLRELHNCWLQA